VLRRNQERYGSLRRALRHKHFGVWRPVTWDEYYRQVKDFALGLLALGMQPQDRVLIIGDNQPPWYYAELAVQANRGIAVGMFAELPAEEIRSIAADTAARFAVIEGQEQADKFLQIAAGLPALEKIVYWSYKGLSAYGDGLLIGWREALERGRALENTHPGRFEQNVEAGRADDPCAIVYTAGTTGDAPKGAVHTHRSLRAGADHLLAQAPWTPEDNLVPYLPPVWILEKWMNLGCHLLSGATLNLAEAPETHWRDSRETGPSIVYNRARIWESLASGVQARVLAADPLKRWAYRRLMPIGFSAAESRSGGRPPGALGKMAYALADRLLFRSIKRSLGLMNARICYSAAGALSPEALKFYHALNTPLKSLYATTEGGLLAGGGPQDIHPETFGSVRADAEVRIAAGGEIVSRQPGTFLGYWNNAGKTAEVLEAGWFRSGDGGRLDADGRLVFLDRLEDLIALPGGKRMCPQGIEARLRSSPYIRDAWVLYSRAAAGPAAAVVIDPAAVGRFAGQRQVAFASFSELAQAPEVYELIREAIERVNRGLPEEARVRRFVNLHQEFDPEESEVTRTRHLRRAFLRKNYRSLVEAIDADADQVEVPVRNRPAAAGTTLRIASAQGAGA
jgi:long-chain acyl-CoA synthetase